MATELLQARSSSRSRLGSVVFAAALLGATTVGSVWYLSVPGTDRTADGAMAEGPASYGGVEPDDLITALGASSITSLETMMATLRHHQPGDIVNVVVKRGVDSVGSAGHRQRPRP